MQNHINKYIEQALEQAHHAQQEGDVPIGAVLVQGDKVISARGNEIVQRKDPTAHAEMLVLREGAQKLGTERLVNCDVYVTLEPCPMCAQAISFARIRRLYFGAYDPKGGGVEHGPRIFEQSTCHHKPEVIGGVSEERCGELLKDFFKSKRL